MRGTPETNPLLASDCSFTHHLPRYEVTERGGISLQAHCTSPDTLPLRFSSLSISKDWHPPRSACFVHLLIARHVKSVRYCRPQQFHLGMNLFVSISAHPGTIPTLATSTQLCTASSLPYHYQHLGACRAVLPARLHACPPARLLAWDRDGLS